MTLSPEYRRAVYMLQLGICCIPAHGKRAAVPWKVYQSRFPTPDDLAGWFMGGTENYCVITGAISGLVVVDADTPEAVEYVEANLPESPLVVVTSRGRHYYYGHPGVDVQCITDGIPAGLDLKADGGYVIGPGSRHESGIKYELMGLESWPLDFRERLPIYDPAWISKRPPAPPEPPSAGLLIDWDDPSNDPEAEYRYCQSALDSEVASLRGMPEGGRNNALNKAAYSMGQLVGSADFTPQDLARELFEASQAMRPPMSQIEAQKTIESGMKSGLDNPRILPMLSKITAPAILDNEPAKHNEASIAPLVSPLWNRDIADWDEKPIEWLWPGVIPRAMLTMVVGEGGVGKSTLLLDIAARVTLGLPFPDRIDQIMAPGRVGIMSAEDDPERMLKPRCRLAGADPRLINTIYGPPAGDESGPPTWLMLDQHMLKLEQYLRMPTPAPWRLLIIDPITSYLGAVDMNENSAVRVLLARLGIIASVHNMAVVIVNHTNKAIGQNSAVRRALGSVAFSDAARVHLTVARSPDDREVRVMAPAKTNLDLAAGMEYRLERTPGEQHPSIKWLPGYTTWTADELLLGRRLDADFGSKTTGKRDQPAKLSAGEWLDRMIGSREMARGDLMQASKVAGYRRVDILDALEVAGVTERVRAKRKVLRINRNDLGQ